ncbi:streptococcal 67 kDa myosin-cross-reactive antigen like family-domain-containing protein [Aspergillus filifer]
MTRDPTNLDAYILGSGLASLTSAVHLIREANVPPNRVHIIETLSLAGGTTVSYGDAKKGYDFRADMRPQFNDSCVDDLLRLVPSKVNPDQNKTVRDDVLEFAESMGNVCSKNRERTRFLTRSRKKRDSVGKADAKKAGLGLRDRMEMVLLTTKSEKVLGRARICDCFSKGFFGSGYWLGLASTFGLKPSHSASEFRRYLQHFNNLHDLNHPHPLDLGQYNVHESIVAPIAHYLQSVGVDFRFDTTISDILFDYENRLDTNDPTRVTGIQTCPFGAISSSSTASASQHDSARSSSLPKDEETITLNEDDIVIVNLGSIYSSIVTGTNTHAPPSFDTTSFSPNFDDADDPNASQITAELDENWLLWLELCTKHPKFGNAYNFCTRLTSSRLESFTITLKSEEFLNSIRSITGDQKLGGAKYPNKLLTLRDSPWLITLNIPPQPLFPDQPGDVSVVYGYALHPEKPGLFTGQRPMVQCSGREILAEILEYLSLHPDTMDSILKSSITIPCIQPRAASTLLPRDVGDRPHIIPRGVSNMALIGPFVEIEGEVVVTTDYSVRGAQRAVRSLMGIKGNGRGRRDSGYGDVLAGGGKSRSGSGSESAAGSGSGVQRRKSKRASVAGLLGLSS